MSWTTAVSPLCPLCCLLFELAKCWNYFVSQLFPSWWGLVLKDLSSIITYLLVSSVSCSREVGSSWNGDILPVKRILSFASCTNWQKRDASGPAKWGIQMQCISTKGSKGCNRPTSACKLEFSVKDISFNGTLHTPFPWDNVRHRWGSKLSSPLPDWKQVQ